MTLLSNVDLVLLGDLHPTQMTVGYREVEHKRLRWQARARLSEEGRRPALIAPVVLGPGGGLYLIDRHHHACAARREGLERILVRRIADFSGLAAVALWPALEAKGWCHPFDAEGRRRPYEELPSTIGALSDDPYRSLASALRRGGGFSKTVAPYSEFAWADFLRERISQAAVAEDFEAALVDALALSQTDAARTLPGWKGGDPALGSAPLCVKSNIQHPLALQSIAVRNRQHANT